MKLNFPRRRMILFYTAYLVCTINGIAQKNIPTYLDEAIPMEERIENALLLMTLEEKIAMCHAQSKFSTPGCPRLGIPEIWMSDGPHGVRMEFEWDTWTHADWTNDSCTAFPALTCLAATFNPQLSYEYGKAIGEEARFRKKDIILGPGVNIYRTPLSGRNFEYMGEDPYLSSIMVVPYIEGVQKNGVAACMKHFALNNQEKWRNSINIEVSNRALHEIYLPAFKAGVEKGKVWAVMGSYNKYKGMYCSHNDILINRILKGDWNFNGVLITDWGSAHDTEQAAKYGLDIEMGTWTNGLSWGLSAAYNKYHMAQPFLRKIQNNELPESLLDDKIRRILRLCFRTNMNRNRPWGSFGTVEHANIARRIAEEGIVLTKNEQSFFPIPKDKNIKIAVIGENAIKKLTEGGGSSELKPKKEIPPLQGLIEKYGKGNVLYSMGYASGPPSYDEIIPSPYNADSLLTAAVNIAEQADIVLFIGGLNKNNSEDCEGDDRKDFHLSFGQDKLINELLKVNRKLGVILISGNAVAMPWIKEVPGIIQSWYLGSESGTALANIISGETNPSGKLPFSYPKRLEDNSAHYFGTESYPGDSLNVYYKDDIFVGYRWHDTRKITPLFAFGHGLSYTTFKYGTLNTDKENYLTTDTIRIQFPITNTGNRDGAETVQIYIGQKKPSIPRPTKELKGFQKVFLKTGETKMVTINIAVWDLAYYDESEQKWLVEVDKYNIYCASASDNIKTQKQVVIKEQKSKEKDILK